MTKREKRGCWLARFGRLGAVGEASPDLYLDLIRLARLNVSEPVAWQGLAVKDGYGLRKAAFTPNLNADGGPAEFTRHSGLAPMAGQLRCDYEALLVALNPE